MNALVQRLKVVPFGISFFFSSFPEHEFTVRKNPQTKEKEKRSMPQIVQLDSDEDEFEDASETFNVEDDYFVDNVNTARKREPLSKCYK